MEASWQIQDHNDLNLEVSLGVVVRESPLESGFADYLLFVDRVARGAIEAKAKGTNHLLNYICSSNLRNLRLLANLVN